MPIIDRVLKELEVSYEGVFDLHDFLDFLKKWFKSKGYDITEKLYDTKAKGSVHSIKIKWECEKKPTDYDKYIIKITMDATNLKEGKVDGRKVTEGNFKATFDSVEHEKDYEEKWRKKPTLNFFRTVYDRFVIEEKEGRLVKKLKDDTYDTIDEIKGYFNITKEHTNHALKCMV